MNSVKVRKSIHKYIIQNELDHRYIDPHVRAVPDWDDSTLENLEFKDYDDVKEFMDFLEWMDEEDFVKVSYLANIGQNDYQYVMTHCNAVLVNVNSLADAARSEMEERFSSLSEYPELERYIDYDAYANDMLNSGCWYEYEGYVILNADQY